MQYSCQEVKSKLCSLQAVSADQYEIIATILGRALGLNQLLKPVLTSWQPAPQRWQTKGNPPIVQEAASAREGPETPEEVATTPCNNYSHSYMRVQATA